MHNGVCVVSLYSASLGGDAHASHPCKWVRSRLGFMDEDESWLPRELQHVMHLVTLHLLICQFCLGNAQNCSRLRLCYSWNSSHSGRYWAFSHRLWNCCKILWCIEGTSLSKYFLYKWFRRWKPTELFFCRGSWKSSLATIDSEWQLCQVLNNLKEILKQSLHPTSFWMKV